MHLQEVDTGRQSRSQSTVRERPSIKEQQLIGLNKNIKQLNLQLDGKIEPENKRQLKDQLALTTAQRDVLQRNYEQNA